MKSLVIEGKLNMPNTRTHTGPKRPLTPGQIHRIRAHLDIGNRTRDLALFDTALDSKLRGCDLVRLRVSDVYSEGSVLSRARVQQRKTGVFVKFELTHDTRQSIQRHIEEAKLTERDPLFPSRVRERPHLSERQYARCFKSWVRAIGLDETYYGSHSMRRTKVSIIYQRTRNIRAVQILLGHTKLENTIRYLGVDEDDALDLAERTNI